MDELKDRREWEYEVANGDTVLGLDDWREHKRIRLASEPGVMASRWIAWQALADVVTEWASHLSPELYVFFLEDASYDSFIKNVIGNAGRAVKSGG